VDQVFISDELQPYFVGVFADLALRSSTPPLNFKIKSIDRVTFLEYVNLPGIVSDRFFLLATEGAKENRIVQEQFVNLMLRTFASSLDDKMELAFSMYDFDGDGEITAEDVRILLSYIPFRRSKH